MTIVHIIASMERGGRERQLSIICNNSKSFDNRIIYYNKGITDYIDEYKLQGKVNFVEPRSFLKRCINTIRISRELQAKAIVVWGPMETVLGMFTAFLLRVPMINFSIRHGIRLKKFIHIFRTFLLHVSKHVVANSVAGLKANNLKKGIVIYNGIEMIPDESELIDKKQNKQNKYQFGNKTVLISVANLVPYKDYNTVLNALKEIKKSGFEFLYVIIGEGPNRPLIEQNIEKLGLNGNVLLTGSIQNVDEYLRTADIMVHSSLGEGCSNAILEGMKFGLPIIATNVGGTPEIVQKDNARLFEYGDVDELVKLLQELLENPNLVSSMGRKSHTIALKRFSITKMISDYDRTIQAILSKDYSAIKDIYVKVV